jgi:hypothetical protein
MLTSGEKTQQLLGCVRGRRLHRFPIVELPGTFALAVHFSQLHALRPSRLALEQALWAARNGAAALFLVGTERLHARWACREFAAGTGGLAKWEEGSHEERWGRADDPRVARQERTLLAELPKRHL